MITECFVLFLSYHRCIRNLFITMYVKVMYGTWSQNTTVSMLIRLLKVYRVQAERWELLIIKAMHAN